MAPAVLSDLGLVPAAAEDIPTRAPTSSPEPGKVPDKFSVSVVVCTPDGSLKNASGTWLAMTASHREGDLEPLVAALDEPSAPRGGTCTSGQARRPHCGSSTPSGVRCGRCGRQTGAELPQQAVSDALDELEETDSEKYPVRLVVPTKPTGTTGPTGQR